mmetsp:Transcript_3360/g.10314  ORF Transcript_3360/g.10314 Transcript_3360/m.10314 type:complete len:113 (-) Transcript_3360:26-364(-)
MYFQGMVKPVRHVSWGEVDLVDYDAPPTPRTPPTASWSKVEDDKEDDASPSGVPVPTVVVPQHNVITATSGLTEMVLGGSNLFERRRQQLSKQRAISTEGSENKNEGCRAAH